MSSLQEIKNRLESIHSTKKITKAMKLVSTAKLQKSKGNLKSIQEYYISVYQMFHDLLENVKDVSKLFPQNNKDSILYLVITSDLGLCGGYNSNILKILKQLNRKQDKVIMIGSKGFMSLKSNSIKMFSHYQNIGDDPNYLIASEISKEAMNQYLLGNINKIKIIHTKFINSITFKSTVTQLLPVLKEKTTTSNNLQAIAEFEPNVEVVLKNALPLYVSTMIFSYMVESKVTEMSSRRIAMENATENAEDLIKHLELKYNRARQSAITQEITEIIAGSDVKE